MHANAKAYLWVGHKVLEILFVFLNHVFSSYGLAGCRNLDSGAFLTACAIANTKKGDPRAALFQNPLRDFDYIMPPMPPLQTALRPEALWNHGRS
jgi:hypothetical protein